MVDRLMKLALLARATCLVAVAIRRGGCSIGWTLIGRGDDTVGNPRRAQIDQCELLELVLLLKLDKQFPVEQFEVTVSQSTVPSPPLINNEINR